jgi:hypothetical protein
MQTAPEAKSQPEAAHQARIALGVWVTFFCVNVLLNGTIPFALGNDLRSWTYSLAKDVLYHAVIYAGLFLLVPLIVVKGWPHVRQPAFLVPLLVAAVAIILRPFARVTTVLVVIALIYLHWRFNLADFGFRTRGVKGDIVAVLLLALAAFVPVLLKPGPYLPVLGQGITAALDRMLLNPASTVENLFYFGFLAERLVAVTGRWLTPLLIGLMYTAHELSNPEYWYENMSFVFVFIGIVLVTLIYLWRHSVIVIWLGDGLGRFVSRLF